MEKIHSLSDLDDAIKLLEFKKAEEEQLLKEISYMTYESIKPINIIKNLFKDSVESQDIKDNLINVSVGLGFGYLSKILFQSVVRVPFKKIIGSALMLSVENLIAKNPDIVSTLSSLFLNIFRKKSDEKDSKDGDYEEDVHREVDDEFMDLENIY
ncbi:MAG: hypothetical protein PHW92_04995 [Lutibacter sp.]|nr:hypothetical protein [Lutibacter sp.]